MGPSYSYHRLIDMFPFAASAAEGVLPNAQTFILIGFAAFLLPLVARRLKLPSVVLEILFGLLIGPEVLSLIAAESTSEGFVLVLAELGLFLLMFLAGFEIDFTSLEREGRGPVVTGLVGYVVIVALAWVGFGFVDLANSNERIFLTLLVSAGSAGIIIPALRATNRSVTAQGQLTIVVGIIAEFLAATGIIIFSVWFRSGWGVEMLAVPLFVVILLVSLWVMRTIAWWIPDRAERLFASDDPDELGIRFSLALLFLFVGLSIALGMDPILGAFMAGAIFAFVFRNSGDLEERLAGFSYGFLIPIFFISVGVAFPLDALRDPSVLQTAAAIIVVGVLAKMIPSPLLMRRGLSLRDSLGAGVLVAGQLSVIIALAEVGVQIGVIDEGLSAGAVLLVGVTAILSPIAFRFLSPPLAVPSTDQSEADL
ncbi:MAG: cation:proton antiporter [Actinomycetota bacterium]|nr:cation:proton antiporter [Actinomycetota bacterium]